MKITAAVLLAVFMLQGPRLAAQEMTPRASLDGSFYQGGRSTVDGTRLDDLQRDSKLGFTVGYPVARGHVIKLNYSLGSVSDSREDFDIFVLRY